MEILLATYNGERHLDALLHSLEIQTYGNWIVIARDDCSTDRTSGLLQVWQQRLKGKLVILPDSGPTSIGSCLNFGVLMQASRSDYVMFADQDDVWIPDKVKASLEALLALEACWGSDTPCLVCSDAVVVDEHLTLRHPSRWRHSGTFPNRLIRPVQISLDNPVQGCTAIVNRALLNLSLPVPAVASYGDWWLALSALAFGKVFYIKKPTLLWRRHDSNASHYSSLTDDFLANLRGLNTAHLRVKSMLSKSLPIVGEFLARYSSQLASGDRAALEAFLRLGRSSFFSRRYLILRHHILFTSLIKSIGFFLFV